MLKKRLTLLLIIVFINPLFAQKQIEIPNGSNAKQIVRILKNEHIIKYETPFYWYLKLNNVGQNLRAGSFKLSHKYSYKRISNILQEKEGAGSMETVTIPEGFSTIEIAQTLEKNNIIKDATKFIAYLETQAKGELIGKFPFLQDYPENTLEGYLFPNTYIFAKGISYKEITATFLSEFSKQILPIWENKKNTSYTLHETLTLASIIERESQIKSEMPLISGVFHNRLRRGIPLAACPTVGYAIGNPRKKVITYKDLKSTSPYNTYKFKGLPPTPIASPGKNAVIASLTPSTTKLLYFVANGDGSHTFSKTLKDHVNAQKRILRKQNK